MVLNIILFPLFPLFCRCQNLVDACSPDPCPSGFSCKMLEGSIHCDPIPRLSKSFGYVEIAEICAGLMGLVFLAGGFVCVRKRYISHKKYKSGCVQDSNTYFQTGLTKSMMRDGGDTPPMEMSTLIGLGNNLDHSPFRSLKPREQRELAQAGLRPQKAQGPVVCSVAPNLPPPPSSSSDNDSIMKNHWEPSFEGESARIYVDRRFTRYKKDK